VSQHINTTFIIYILFLLMCCTDTEVQTWHMFLSLSLAFPSNDFKRYLHLESAKAAHCLMKKKKRPNNRYIPSQWNRSMSLGFDSRNCHSVLWRWIDYEKVIISSCAELWQSNIINFTPSSDLLKCNV
jgi:hypothetical protein